MQEYIVEFETALLAEEVGLEMFVDEAWNINVYNRVNRKALPYHVHSAYPDKEEYLFAPYQELLKKWLRKKHNLHINVDCFSEQGGTKWDYQVVKCDYNSVGLPGYILTEFDDYRNYLTYENALEDGLVEALKWVKFRKEQLCQKNESQKEK